MGIDVIQSLLDRIGKFLDDFRVLFQVALFRAVGRIGNIAGICSQRSHHIAGAFFLQAGGEGLKFDGVIGVVIGESGRRQPEADALVDGQIGFGIDAVFLQDIFKNHLGHSPGPAA